MKNKLPSMIGLVIAAIAGLSFQVFAEETPAAAVKSAATEKSATTAKTTKAISAADKKAIKEIFKGVDSSKYRLQFNGGKEVVGNRKVSMRQLEQVQKIRNPAEAAGYVILIVSDDGIVYIVAVSKGQVDLEGLLGKEKTMRLNQIAAKYSR